MEEMVSVPYRVILFFNRNQLSLYKKGPMFQSPIGESYFSIIHAKDGRMPERSVSVPYRGILFFNYSSPALAHDYTVSVPYRGILFFNHV